MNVKAYKRTKYFIAYGKDKVRIIMTYNFRCVIFFAESSPRHQIYVVIHSQFIIYFHCSSRQFYYGGKGELFMTTQHQKI